MYLPHLEFLLPLFLIFSWTIDIVLAQKGDSGYVYCYQPCMITACGDAFFNDCTCGYNTKFDIMNCTARTCWDGSQASRDSLSFLRQCSMILNPFVPIPVIPFSCVPVSPASRYLPLPPVIWPVPFVKSLLPYTFLPHPPFPPLLRQPQLFLRTLHL